MGQYFHVAAPRARLTLRLGGRSEELLADRYGRYLVNFLVVPVNPMATPMIDTNRTKRLIKGLEKKRHRRLKEGWALGLGSRARQHGAKRAKANATLPSNFLTLPSELLCLVFDHLDYIEDCVSLGMANRKLWSLAEEVLNKHYQSLFGELAGESIVCLGDELDPWDCPPGLFSDAEINSLKQKTFGDMMLPGIAVDWGDEAEVPTLPFAIYKFTDPLVSQDLKEAGHIRSADSQIRTYFEFNGMAGDDAFKAVASKLHVEPSTYVPDDQPWILRNLTTKEFIRSEAVALRPEFIQGPYIDCLGFGEVVLSCICWGSSYNAYLGKPDPLHRGNWAGHSFDIVTFGSHQEQQHIEGGEWTDAGAKVMHHVSEIYQELFGPNWRDDLIGSVMSYRYRGSYEI